MINNPGSWALALARLHRLEDGRYEYHTKRGGRLLLTASSLLKRLLLGFAERTSVRSNNFLPTLDYIWAGGFGD